ncbi:relaxase domain-containing protein [Frigoriglobus tundricola]|uniref:TrwC relaxase domain-containing protein n=1 Tax=Frigoriglobus tundricola TaxID=2774151 RepID=A0A6M5Z523_9BACT|nr:relaxase domain-containing protein [Frigoriglobus tundricola]QJX01166.1 hypothetical protein FTUN_8805 [Frigoriglobus tundricola]
MGTVNKAYLDHRFFGDAGPTGMRFGLGATDLGFTNPYDARQRELFVAGVRPDTGAPMLRKQVNAPNHLYGPIYGTSLSFNYWYKTLAPEHKEQVRQAGLDAAQAVEMLRDAQLVMHGTANKVTVAHPCRSVTLTVCHENNNNMEAFVHWHQLAQRAGVRTQFVGVEENGAPTQKAVHVTGSLRNADEAFYGHQARNDELFQIALGQHLEKRLGVKLDFVNGMLEVPGVTQEQRDSVSTRHKQIKSFLERHPELDAVPHRKAIATARTRTEPVPFDRSKYHALWRDEVRTFDNRPWAKPLKPEKADGFFARLHDEYVKGLASVGKAIIGARFGWTNKVVGVRDVDLFLAQVSKRSKRSGHRAAVRAVWAEVRSGGDRFVAAAMAGYKRGRKPLTHLGRGAAVVIPRHVTLTQAQAEKLRALASRRGWTVRHNGLILEGPGRAAARTERDPAQSPSRY